VHHQDEHFLPLEAVALWEGVTPDELGWPASPSRLLLSAVYLGLLVTETAPALWAQGASLTDRMQTIAQWTLDRYHDPTPLFALGRWISMVFGVLQVLAVYWAVRRWHTPRAGLIAALMAATAPVAVLHSQLILADVAGLLGATWLMGFLAPARGHPDRTPVLAGLALGLATASKYHFAIWYIAGCAAIWLNARRDWSLSPLHALGCLGRFTATAIGVHLLLVPWIWLNPGLAAKELMDTAFSSLVPMGSTIGGIAPPVIPVPQRALMNLTTGLEGFGALVLLGALVGGSRLIRRWRVVDAPLLLVTATGLLVLATAAITFDRYGLFIFPAFLWLAAIEYEGLLSHARRAMRIAGLAVFVVALIITLGQLDESQRFVGQLDSDGQAYRWLRTHLTPGARIAVNTEYSRRFPRAAEQLRRDLEKLSHPDAYISKMAVNGFVVASLLEPMRLAVLNHESYESHWWRRELAGNRPGGYEVFYYHDAPRYNALRTDKAVAEYVDGLRDPAKGFDALLLSRRIDLPIEPAVEFQGQPGRALYLYVRRPAGNDFSSR
jgi:hypothetical protein